MWKPRLILATGAAVVAFTIAAHDRTAAQAPDPRTLPVLQHTNLEYLGRFRLPSTAINGQSFTGAQGLIAFNPAGNGGNGSLFVGWGNTLSWTDDRTARMAEVTIPEPSLEANINSLNMAQYISGQGFVDPTEQHLDEVTPGSDFIGLNGHMVFGNRIIGTAYSSYDSSNSLRVTHYSRSIDLTEPSFAGFSEVWDTGKANFVSGLLANVPQEWQAALGGPALTGNCCVSIISNTSWGPAAFSFDPAAIGQSSVTATPLLYYNADHPTLGTYSNPNASMMWNQATTIRGVTIINGTRTLLYFGSIGTGEPCYGTTTSDPNQHGDPNPAGHQWCYDPPNGGTSGNHAYPYRFQLWAYDLNDLADVKANPTAHKPWDAVPDVWPLTEMPADPQTPHERLRPGGIAYDPQSKRLYVVADFIDHDGYGDRPLVYVYKVNVPAGSTVNDVSLSADRVAPQPPNTTVTFTAAPTGGVTPYQYQWKVFDGSTWSYQAWGASSTFQWTPTAANANYKVGVGVRSSGNTGSPEASTDMTFAVSSGSGTVSSLSIAADLQAPQAAGTPITWTATAIGGTGPLEYKWWWWDGGSSHDQTGWTTSATYTWTPIWGNANYAIKAWVRSAGNTTNTPEAETEAPFATTGPGPATSVSLSTSHASPQPLGTTITWTATPTGGATPQQYQWLTLEPGGWTLAQDWSTSNTFAWTPTRADANHKVAVRVRSAGNTSSTPEAELGVWYSIQ